VSETRAQRGRELAERIAGDKIRFRIIDREDPRQAISGKLTRGHAESPPPDAVSPAATAEAAEELYERHYTRWLDEEIPALDGSTPRDAACSSSLRPRLAEMLKDLFELQRRKTFWVQDSLSWMLDRTEPDITGNDLRLPFGCFALVFDDRHTLSVAERMLSTETACNIRGRILRVMTVYVTDAALPGARGISIAFAFDALADKWPYLVTRDLPNATPHAETGAHALRSGAPASVYGPRALAQGQLPLERPPATLDSAVLERAPSRRGRRKGVPAKAAGSMATRASSGWSRFTAMKDAGIGGRTVTIAIAPKAAHSKEPEV
jgi:hypothetical protein